MRGLKRGLLGGLLLALIVFFLPDALLGAITVGTGLASALPAAAPPLGTTARLMLALLALIIGFGLTLWLVRRRKSSWDYDDNFDPEPLPAAEQMVVSPAMAADRPADDRLSRIEASVAALSKGKTNGDHAAILARLEALETQIRERLAAIDTRLASKGGGATPLSSLDREHLGQAIAGIRRSIDGA